MVTVLRTWIVLSGSSRCPGLAWREAARVRPQQASALARKMPGRAPLAVMASTGSAFAAWLPGAVADEQGQDFADGGFLAGWFWLREVRLDLVTVTPAVFLPDDVAGCGQVGDDAAGAAFGMPRLAATSRNRAPRIACDAQQRPGVTGQEAPARHP